jgi:hypothetical protein
MTDRSSDDARVQIIESTPLFIELMKHNWESVRDAATKTLLNFVDNCVSLPYLYHGRNVYGRAYHFPLAAFDFQDVARLIDNPSPDVVVSVLKLISALRHHGRSFV